MICVKCRNQLPPGAQVCPHCGAAVEVTQQAVLPNQLYGYEHAPQGYPQNPAAPIGCPQAIQGYIPPQGCVPPQGYVLPQMTMPSGYPSVQRQTPPLPPMPGSYAFALVMGILGIVGGSIGTFCWGLIAAGIASVLSIAAVVLGVNAAKQTGRPRSNGAMICGIVGIVLSVFFSAGCFVYGLSCTYDSCTGVRGCEKYGYYGFIGGACVDSCESRSTTTDYDNY